MLKRVVLLIFAISFSFIGSASGCNWPPIGEMATTSPAVGNADIEALFAANIVRPSLPPDEVPEDEICTDFAERGLLRIHYLDTTGKKIKLQVLFGDSSVTYNLKADGSLEDFPLQYGDGKYTARILQNILQDQYSVVRAKTFDVKLSDQNAVFLNSIQNIDWDYDRIAINAVKDIIAASLTDGSGLHFSCTQDLYQYVIDNIEYDFDKVFQLLYNYLPDIDKTYVEGKGICYDYSALLSAMLRSIGIPAKLVTGYANYDPNTYHAWNEVYVNGSWITIDSTRDAGSAGNEMQKSKDKYQTVHEY